MLNGMLSGSLDARRFAAATTVAADYVFTLPAVIVRAISGAWLVAPAGFDPADFWLVVTYGLYVMAGVCWLPIVVIQIKIKHLLNAQAAGVAIDGGSIERLTRRWIMLGIPAFSAMLIVFYLMVAKPSW